MDIAGASLSTSRGFVRCWVFGRKSDVLQLHGPLLAYEFLVGLRRGEIWFARRRSWRYHIYDFGTMGALPRQSKLLHHSHWLNHNRTRSAPTL